jgi:hypothetical protein
MNVKPGYENLAAVLQKALDQAQTGKGHERHANDKPFDRQPILEITRMVGLGYPLGQASKKAQEAARLPAGRAQAELLGAINYLAAAWLHLEEVRPVPVDLEAEPAAHSAAQVGGSKPWK